MKKVSVIIPVYNTEKYLSKCLNSVINQSLKEIEIIVINDCSTDNSLKIIEEFVKKDNRIVLINNENNKGVSTSRNIGIKFATGEYISMIDSDDWIEKEMLKEMYEMCKKEEADIVITDFYENYGEQIKYIQDQETKNDFTNIDYIENLCLIKGYSSLWNKLLKRELFINNNINLPAGIIMGEDLCTLIKLYFLSKKTIKLNQGYYHYVYNDNSVTKAKTININKLKDIDFVLDDIELFFNDKNIDISLNELRFNHLTNWIFNVKYDFKNSEYMKIYRKYLFTARKVSLKKIKSNKRKFLGTVLKILGFKLIFICIWNFNEFCTKLRKHR